MSQVIEVKMPSIGDAAAMPVIEVLVKVGDVVAVDDAICTLESDKATMDVPSSAAGVVQEVLVKVGEKVAEGAVLLRLESNEVAVQPAPPPLATPSVSATATATATASLASPAPASAVATTHAGSVDLECDVLVLGGGPGGYSAAFRSADLGQKTVVGGALCLAWRRMPKRWLYPLQSVVAYRLGDGGSTAFGVTGDRLRCQQC